MDHSSANSPSQPDPAAARHPGRGKGRARTRPKGRMANPEDVAEIANLLGNRPRRRDLLIEFLHAIQGRYGSLSLGRLAALAQEMKIPLVEVYEVASFYHNFDIRREGEESGVVQVVRVCDSLPCMLRGAYKLSELLTENLGHNVRIEHAACMGRCQQAPVVRLGDNYIGDASLETVAAAAIGGEDGSKIPEYRDYDAYVSDGGYRLLSACRAGT
ncbi:MAG: NAD(P)H-dependent oxidoreductase subunit E, partial [Rhodospirillales bacterium]|nr:NAD(P)H-dependent oxidoreductase subunit E [Rhodospirillales bacterium]